MSKLKSGDKKIIQLRKKGYFIVESKNKSKKAVIILQDFFKKNPNYFVNFILEDIAFTNKKSLRNKIRTKDNNTNNYTKNPYQLKGNIVIASFGKKGKIQLVKLHKYLSSNNKIIKILNSLDKKKIGNYRQNLYLVYSHLKNIIDDEDTDLINEKTRVAIEKVTYIAKTILYKTYQNRSFAWNIITWGLSSIAIIISIIAIVLQYV